MSKPIELDIIRNDLPLVVIVDPSDDSTGYVRDNITSDHGILFIEGQPVALTDTENKEAREYLLDANDMRDGMKFSGICVPWHDPSEQRNY